MTVVGTVFDYLDAQGFYDSAAHKHNHECTA
jgi:hypothetical protein